MATIPRDTSIDSTLSLMKDGFTFLQKKSQEANSDVFQIRMMGMPVICMTGEDAAKIFYDPERFIRKGAIPKRVQKTLLGEDGVQTLDGDIHRHRKELFMSFMSPESIQQLVDLTAEQWQSSIKKWMAADTVVLFRETQDLLCITACNWVGVPLQENEVQQRALDFTAMVDAFGAVGPRHWRGKRARKRAEAWIMELVEKERNGNPQFKEHSPAHAITWHKGLNGELLDQHMAAVEIINLLRPIVAISYYITFAALALHDYPDCKTNIRLHGDAYIEWFAQEVRRFYPFAPFVGAIVRNDFEWKGYQFTKDTMVFLDIYGTNHDSHLWGNPDEFMPERFSQWNESPYNFMPQGGGHYHNGHRCAGERITIELMKQAVHFLVNEMDYHVPHQDLSFSLSRMPTYPESGFILSLA